MHGWNMNSAWIQKKTIFDLAWISKNLFKEIFRKFLFFTEKLFFLGVITNKKGPNLSAFWTSPPPLVPDLQIARSFFFRLSNWLRNFVNLSSILIMGLDFCCENLEMFDKLTMNCHLRSYYIILYTIEPNEFLLSSFLIHLNRILMEKFRLQVQMRTHKNSCDSSEIFLPIPEIFWW